MIQLPSDFVSNIASSTNSNISGLAPFATLVIGVLLAVVVITVLIGAITSHK